MSSDSDRVLAQIQAATDEWENARPPIAPLELSADAASWNPERAERADDDDDGPVLCPSCLHPPGGAPVHESGRSSCHCTWNAAWAERDDDDVWPISTRNRVLAAHHLNETAAQLRERLDALGYTALGYVVCPECGTVFHVDRLRIEHHAIENVLDREPHICAYSCMRARPPCGCLVQRSFTIIPQDDSVRRRLEWGDPL